MDMEENRKKAEEVIEVKEQTAEERKTEQEVASWKPKTKIGLLVKEGKIKDIDEVLEKSGMPIDIAIYFDTTDQVVIKRLSGRRVCKSCGANFHITNIPPKKEGVCDLCGSALIHREDDKEETVRNRLEVYKKETSGLIDYYKRKGILRTVSGDLDVKELFGVISKLLKDTIKIRC